MNKNFQVISKSCVIGFGLLSLVACSHTSPKASLPAPKREILVVAHRGASGYRPEHTLAAYELGIAQGADFIEPDLVVTKDDILIVRHENEISETTDVAQKFPGRKKTKNIDGRKVTGWFAEDFTLKEIKSLRAKERLPKRDQSQNGLHEIPTFAEVIELAKRKSAETGRTIGVFPETKHPTYFTSIGKPLEPLLAAELKKADWDKAADPVIIQSFELSSLRKMRELVGSRLVFLFGHPAEKPYDNQVSGDGKTYGDYLKPREFAALSKLLYGIGPHTRMIVPQTSSGALGKATPLVALAHQAGLKVIPYTFRSDANFLAAEYKGNPLLEYKQFYEIGVDGVFSDFPDHAVKARDAQ